MYEKWTPILESNSIPPEFGQGSDFESPVVFSEEYIECINSNHTLKLAFDSAAEVQSGEMSEQEYRTEFGYGSREVHQRSLEYAMSLSSQYVRTCDRTKLYVCRGFGIVVGWIDETIVIAALGIMPKSVDELWEEPPTFATYPFYQHESFELKGHSPSD